MSTSIEVISGRILVRPGFADLAVCSRLGGKWDATTAAWIFPAAEKYARLLGKNLHTALAADSLAAMLPSIVTDGNSLQDLSRAPPVPAGDNGADPEKPAVAPQLDLAIPEGLLTRPWRHQLAAFAFCLQHFAMGMFGLLLAMGMGTGKTLVALMVMLERKATRTLILCPLRVAPVWATRLKGMCDCMVVVAWMTSSAGSVRKKQEIAAEKLRLAEARGVPFVCVINYESFWREPVQRLGREEPAGTCSSWMRPTASSRQRQGLPGCEADAAAGASGWA